MLFNELLIKKAKNKEQSKKKLTEESSIYNFIMELFTTNESAPLKPYYGSNFIKNIGDRFNLPKLNYYILEEKEIMKKHKIEECKVTKVSNKKNSAYIEFEVSVNNKNINISFVSVWSYDKFTSEALFEPI